MANENQAQAVGGYGYESDEVKLSTLHFGGNFGNCFMTKFEYNDHAGKEGAEGEALDIVFNIGGTEKNMRMFPVTKAFDKDNTEVTDPQHPAFIAAQKNFNAICVQILKCFKDEDSVKAALTKRINSFKEFCGILMAGVPKNFSEVPLDIFLQWQWSITGENDKTYLELPKKISYGRFVCKHEIPTSGEWTKVVTDSELYYIDATAKQVEENPELKKTAPRHSNFSRNQWFVNSKFFTQQKEEAGNVLNESAGNNNAASNTPAASGNPAW